MFLKNKVINDKINKIVTDSGFLVVYQYNNVNSKQWNELKNKLSEFKTIKSFLIKNKSIKKKKFNDHCKNTDLNENPILSLSKKDKTNKRAKLTSTKSDKIVVAQKVLYHLSTFTQGPTYIITGISQEQFKFINSILKNYPNFIFLGGINLNQGFGLTHLDFNFMVQINHCPLAKLTNEVIPTSLKQIPSVFLYKLIETVKLLLLKQSLLFFYLRQHCRQNLIK
jgi:ribosomal protein L10